MLLSGASRKVSEEFTFFFFFNCLINLRKIPGVPLLQVYFRESGDSNVYRGVFTSRKTKVYCFSGKIWV